MVIFLRHTTLLINHTGITVIMYHRDIITDPILITPDIIININPIMDISTVVVREFIQGIITEEIINTAIVQIITGIVAGINNATNAENREI